MWCHFYFTIIISLVFGVLAVTAGLLNLRLPETLGNLVSDYGKYLLGNLVSDYQKHLWGILVLDYQKHLLGNLVLDYQKH